MKLRGGAVLALLGGVLQAQVIGIESRSITLTVAKSVVLGMTDASFTVNIAGDFKTTVDQAVAAVRDLGLTADDLVGIQTIPSGPRPDQMRLTYQFRLVVPLARMGETLAALDKLRRTIDTNLELQYYTAMLTAGGDAVDAARQRVLPEMLQDARRKAQTLADAAQMKLGGVLALGEQTATAGGPAPPQVYFTVTVRFAAEPLSGS